MKNLLLFLLGFISLNLNSQTFSAIGDTIPDDGSTSRDFNINVSGLQNTTNANFGISTVCFTIQHTYDSDLNCWLISPAAKVIVPEGNIPPTKSFAVAAFAPKLTIR